jgi:iron complex outermembrane receptor protein
MHLPNTSTLPKKHLLKTLLAVSITSITSQAIAVEDNIERISVTGSHIKKGDFQSASPIAILDEKDIEGVGAVNVSDLLARIPSIYGDTTGASSNISEQDSGLNTVALRNLGASRTLVLVDGIRYVSGTSAGSGYGVDLNSIPLSMVSRIEVLTGGQSASYGSDAVAGVINLILKKNFEGVSFKAQVGQSSESDKDKSDIELTLGTNFENGNAWFSAGYSSDDGLMASDRDYSRVHKSAVDSDGDGILDMAQFVGSSHILGGRIGGYKGDGTPFVRTADVETSDAFNFHEYRSMLAPTDRTFVASGLSFDINERSRANFNINYSRVESTTFFEPIPLDARNDVFKLSKGGTTGIDIATHPWFAGTNLGNNLLNDGITNLDDVSLTFRRLYEFGGRGAENTRSTFRVAGSYEYDLTNDIYLTLNGTYGVTDQYQQNNGDINLDRARSALTIEEDGFGGYQCSDDIARIQGCVPFNPFKIDGISPEAVNYLAADTNLSGTIEQTVITAIVAGDLDFALTDDVDSLGFALGIEYREEKGEETPDPLRQAGIVRGAKIAKTQGSFDVVDAFAELHIPVIEQLSLDLAVRVGNYSSVGSITNWTAGFNAPVHDSIRFRGAIATAVRAPNVSDLFAGGTATAAFVFDPCDGIDNSSSGNIAENCRSVAAIQNRINADGSFTLTQVEQQNTSGLLVGSPSVKEETADTITLGAVFTPDFINGLSISVDYYDIDIDNAITNTDRTVILDRCYSADPSQFDPLCSGNVVRDGRSGAALEVNSASGNENRIETSGFDLEVAYETPLGDGDIYVGLSANVLGTYDITGIESGDTQSLAGEIMYPELRFNINTSYTLESFNIYWQLRYWDETKDRNDNTNMTEELNSIDSAIYNDLRFSYNILESTNLFIGVNNMFDVQPQELTANHKYQQAGTLTNGSAYNLTGREYYAGVKVDF